jgi:hypothetical protein
MLSQSSVLESPYSLKLGMKSQHTYKKKAKKNLKAKETQDTVERSHSELELVMRDIIPMMAEVGLFFA